MKLGRLTIHENGDLITFSGWQGEGNFLVACGERKAAFMLEIVRRWNLCERDEKQAEEEFKWEGTE